VIFLLFREDISLNISGHDICNMTEIMPCKLSVK